MVRVYYYLFSSCLDFPFKQKTKKKTKKQKQKNVLEKMSFEEHKMIRLMCWERKNLFVFDKGEKKKNVLEVMSFYND